MLALSIILYMYLKKGTKRVLKRTDPKIVLQLYQMLYDTDQILSGNDIPYWLDGGTLLGLVRHKGIIPWDDDVDIQISSEDEDRVYQLGQSFKNLGYELKKVWFGFKVYPINGLEIDGYEWKHPSIDIFPMIIVDDKLKYKNEQAQQTFGSCYYLTNELYPLTRQSFGEITVSTANNPIPYLNRCFGDDYMDYGYMQYDHQHEKALKKIKVKLTVKDKLPAGKTGPIKKLHN